VKQNSNDKDDGVDTIDSSVVTDLIAVLKKRRETVSFAESCTGGLVSSLVARVSGASAVFVGSVVAYANEVKESLLGVPKELIRQHGAVSEPVARAMAKGVCRQLQSTWAVSITGIAGPGGGTPEKPVGTVCFGLVGPNLDLPNFDLASDGDVEQETGPSEVHAETCRFKGDRTQIQTQSAIHALSLLLAELKAIDSGRSEL
jgi:PncC family amidohydrolase